MQETVTARTPAHLWIVGILSLLWSCFGAYDYWFAQGPTNASLASVSLYTQKVPQFQALLAAEGGELPRFYARVKALAALPKTERETALAAAAGFRTSRASP